MVAQAFLFISNGYDPAKDFQALIACVIEPGECADLAIGIRNGERPMGGVEITDGERRGAERCGVSEDAIQVVILEGFSDSIDQLAGDAPKSIITISGRVVGGRFSDAGDAASPSCWRACNGIVSVRYGFSDRARASQSDHVEA